MSTRPETEGWREAHIGFENDGLKIAGLEVWKLPWRSTPAPAVALPHPAHSGQIHRYDIHEVGDASHPVRFAACELSNGVWGFYVPVDPPSVSRDESALRSLMSPDGTIRVDLAAVEWSNSHWVDSPRVSEFATGRVVLDLWNTDWDASVTFPGSQRVRLGFRRYRHAGSLAVEIDLARGTYVIFTGPSLKDALPEAPLADIADGLEAASRRASELAAFAEDGHGAPHAKGRPRPLVAWRTALVILSGALIVIAIGTYWSIHRAPADSRKLDTVPAMPK